MSGPISGHQSLGLSIVQTKNSGADVKKNVRQRRRVLQSVDSGRHLSSGAGTINSRRIFILFLKIYCADVCSLLKRGRNEAT